ncbi:PGF-CTERM sorting domain-containing protein [Halorubellus sp. JP-L1]|uniref:vWA domain-containing protein n=1 Tax=Halorubellus sp. JP-L1 TaxID=2715753 RepID=UPI00140AA5E6|nr:PGF-CTERM sorting domain-containing protein [Halorubellus sp. JP-L1]NHN43177.1 PGF-CTERM sorting domain-containing protein [Halorubellus sp. JP-L1]
MSSDQTRGRESTRGLARTSLPARFAVVVVAVLVVTSTFAAAAAVAADARPTPADVDPTVATHAQTDDRPDVSIDANDSTESTTAASDAVDVVFVFDRSQSMNDERYKLANEMRTFQRSLTERGVDARFGLVTYTKRASVRQPLTDDFDAIERAMIFEPSGDEERASDAVLTATEMEFRDDAERVIVLVTDEDDDSDATARRQAIGRLSGMTFVTLSPSDPATSGCHLHSPPCDNSTTNELKTYADMTGGEWMDVHTDADDAMKHVAETVYEATNAKESSGSESSTQLEVGPDVSAVDRSANRTDVEIGDPVAFNLTVRNDGIVEGSYTAYLTSKGELLGEKTITVDRLSERTVTLVHTFEDPGEYQVVVSNERVDNVDVRDPDPPSVDVSTNDGADRMRVSVTDARAGSPVILDLPESSLLSGTGNQMESVTVRSTRGIVTPSHDLAFDVTLERLEGPPAGTPSLDSDARAVRYLNVTSSLDATELQSVVFEYAKTGDDVTLYRFDDASSSWQALEQRSVDGAPGHVVAGTDQLSTFALVVEDPELTVADVAVGSTSVQTGDRITSTVTVTNNGTAEQSYDATLSLDGEVVTSRTVTVPAGESVDVSLSHAVADAGTYDLSIAGTDQGTLNVSTASAPTTAASTEQPTTTAVDDDGSTTEPTDSTPGFSVAIALVALLAAALVAARRR